MELLVIFGTVVLLFGALIAFGIIGAVIWLLFEFIDVILKAAGIGIAFVLLCVLVLVLL